MKKIKVTKEWAKDHLACRRAKRRFFERWPNGLTLNRRNLYMGAKELPVSDIVWLAGQLRLGGTLDICQYDELYQLAVSANDRWVISQPKKRAVAKSFADLLGL